MNKKLSLFQGLFSHVINISILHINNEVHFLNNTLEKIALQNQGKLKNIIFEDKKNLRLNSREYEYIILSNILSYCTKKYTKH